MSSAKMTDASTITAPKKIDTPKMSEIEADEVIDQLPEIPDMDVVWERIKDHKTEFGFGQGCVILYITIMNGIKQAAKHLIRNGGTGYAHVYTAGWKGCIRLSDKIEVNLYNRKGEPFHFTVDRLLNGNPTKRVIRPKETRIVRGRAIVQPETFEWNYEVRDENSWAKSGWIKLLNTLLETPIDCDDNITPLQLAMQQAAKHDWILTDESDLSIGRQVRLTLCDGSNVAKVVDASASMDDE